MVSPCLHVSFGIFFLIIACSRLTCKRECGIRSAELRVRGCSSGDSGIAPRVERRDSLRHPAGVTRRMTPPSGREASGRRGRRPLRRERNARAGRDAFIAPLPPALTFPSSLFTLPSSFLRQGSLSGTGRAGQPLSHGACVRRAATAPLAQGSLRGKRPLSLPGGRQLPLTGEPKRKKTPQSAWRQTAPLDRGAKAEKGLKKPDFSAKKC